MIPKIWIDWCMPLLSILWDSQLFGLRSTWSIQTGKGSWFGDVYPSPEPVFVIWINLLCPRLECISIWVDPWWRLQRYLQNYQFWSLFHLVHKIDECGSSQNTKSPSWKSYLDNFWSSAFLPILLHTTAFQNWSKWKSSLFKIGKNYKLNNLGSKKSFKM